MTAVVGTQRDVWPPPAVGTGSPTEPRPTERTPRRPSRRERRKQHGFDAFISYSHRREGETALAKQVEQGLEQIGRRWTERRALNVFLDQNDLGANSELTPRLRRDLDQSAWLVFFASPESAATNSYCAKELEHWFETRSDAADRLLIVLTAGTLSFRPDDVEDSDGAAGSDAVDWDRSTAAPDVFRGRLTKQPTYVDLSWARDQTAALSIRHHPRFREAVTWVAAPIHGYESPNELDSDDLRRYRRGRRLRRVGVVALVVLTVVACVAAVVARDQRLEANRQLQRSESRALASAALANAGSEHDLALLQALESVRTAGTAQAWGSLLGVVNEPSRMQQRSSGAHRTVVTALATSTDGRVAASGDAEGSVVLWHVDPEAGANPASSATTLAGGRQQSEIVDLEITEEDGADVVHALSADGGLSSFDAETGDLVGDSSPTQSFVTSAISEDRSVIAGAVDDDDDEWHDRIVVVDAATGEVVDQTPLGPEVIVDRLVFDPGTRTVVGSEGDSVFSWEAGTSEGPVTLSTFDSGVSAFAVSADGELLAVAELEGNIWIVDANQPTDASDRIAFEPAPTSPARALAFAPTDEGAASSGAPREVVSAHTNGDVREWGVYQEEAFAFEQDVARGHRDEVTAVAFRPDGQLLSGGYDGEILWWGGEATGGLGEALPTGGDVHSSDVLDVALLDEHGANVVSLDVEGQLIVTAEDGTGELWPAVGGVGLVDAAGNVLAEAHEDGSISVTVGARPGAAADVTLRDEHGSTPYLLDLSDDGTGLLSISDTAVVWDIATGAVRSRLAIPEDVFVVTALYGAGDRVWIGGFGEDGATALEFDARSGDLVGEPIHHGGPSGNNVSALAVSADGTALATGGTDRAIRLWDPVTHEPLARRQLSGHRDTVTDLAFTPDGEGLVSVDRDGAVRLWDVADRQLVTTFTGPTDGINALAVSADGSTLVVASEDDNVYRWTLDRRQWIARACELATRNMTTAEWDLYGRGRQLRLCDYPGEGPVVDWSERVGG